MNNNKAIFSEELWDLFKAKIIKQGKVKKYLQFDPIFDFTKSHNRIKKLVEDPSLTAISIYSFLPHVKTLIKTPRYRYDDQKESYNLETKTRPILYAAHFDSYVYSFYSFCLNEYYQKYIKLKGYADCILAYRSDLQGDCNIQFAKRAFDSIKEMTTKNGSCAAVALDITGYFDNIEHNLLKTNWCKILNPDNIKQLPMDQYKIYRSVTNYSYVNLKSITKHFKVNSSKIRMAQTLLDLIPNGLAGPSSKAKLDLIRKRRMVVKNKPKKDISNPVSNGTHRGIPQGSPMSAVLSNIYLIDFDEWLYKLSQDLGFSYFRYCDDLLIVCQNQHIESLHKNILKEINEKYYLTIQDRKTEIIEFRPNSKNKIRGFNIKELEVEDRISKEECYYKNLQYLGFEFNGQNVYIRPGSLSRYFRKLKGKVVKTMMMAYGKKSKQPQILKKQIRDRYSHFGERNFIAYARNAAKKEYTNSNGVVKAGLDSGSIRRQLSSHIAIIKKEITRTSSQFAALKGINRKE